jgi:hypothetical protein
MQAMPICPLCRSVHGVFKVSQVYVAGITRAEQRSEYDRQILASVYGKEQLSGAEIHQVAQQFGPPSGRSQVVRPVHPDLVAGMFSAVALVFLLNTFWVAQLAFWAILAIWLVSLAGYAATRKPVLRRYHGLETAAMGKRKGVELSVGKWMKVYYCIDDGCIFNPERSDSAPLSQLQQYLQLPPDAIPPEPLPLEPVPPEPGKA